MRGNELDKYHDGCNLIFFSALLLWGVFARIGKTVDCFWSRDPTRPPPRDHPVSYCMGWVVYIYYIYIVVLWGARVRWSSGGHETKNNNRSPDPRENDDRNCYWKRESQISIIRRVFSQIGLTSKRFRLFLDPTVRISVLRLVGLPVTVG